MRLLILSYLVHSTLLQSAHSQGNVETRIHTKIFAPADVGFGTTITGNSGNPKTIYAGAPKKTKQGAVYRCLATFSSLSNQSTSCSEHIQFGSSNDNTSTGISLTKIGSGVDEYLLTCGNQYMFSCDSAQVKQRMIGRCYTYSLFSRTKTTLSSPCPVECPKTVLLADIVFVMDASGSVGLHLATAINWMIRMSREFTKQINSHEIQVGYVVFSSRIRESLAPKPTSFSELERKMNEINTQASGVTNTAGAIRKGSELLWGTSRPTVAKVMIVVTDGLSSSAEKTRKEAKTARELGITMIAVGVGSGVVTTELGDIATGNQLSSDNVMTVTDYSNLNSILAKLSQAIKETATASIEGGSKNTSTELTQCQIGSSIHANANNLYIGATGSYDRTGSVAEYNMIGFPTIRSFGHLTLKEIQKMFGGEEIKESYFGYSVSSGNMMSPSQQWVVMGAPRFNSRGTVLAYHKADTLRYSIIHPAASSGNWQLGGYYGHGVLVMDLNNDELDDLLVSAPLFTKQSGYDEGVVFVYLNTKRTGPLQWSVSATTPYIPAVLGGNSARSGRFGFSLTNGGDIDQNGYNDVIIGAPGEDLHTGSVYVYFSSSGGLSESWKQRIRGRGITPSIRSFGTAVYGGMDFDGNGYPDIAASAPSSGHILLLRSRIVVSLNLKIRLNPPSMNILRCIRKTNVSCSQVIICASARQLPETTFSFFAMSFRVTVDSLIGDTSKRRLYFQSSALQSSVATNSYNIGNSETCYPFEVRLKTSTVSETVSFATALVAKVEANLTQGHKSKVMSDVLDVNSVTTKTAEWNVDKGCREKQCRSDLSLNATYSETTSGDPVLLTGETKKFSVNLVMENKGPDHAFFPVVNITTNLALIKVTGSCIVVGHSNTADRSTIVKYKNKKAVWQNLMAIDETCAFTMEFGFSNLQTEAAVGEFWVIGVVYTNAGENASIDTVEDNNRIEFKKNIQYKSDLYLEGLSSPESVFFYSDRNDTSVSSLEDDSLGGNKTNVNHTYTVLNNGPLGMANSIVRFFWPQETENGDLLLYLVNLECEPKDTCKCATSGIANKLNLTDLPQSVGVPGSTTQLHAVDTYRKINSSDKMDCKKYRCHSVSCTFSFLAPFKSLTIRARLKPWVPTFGENFTSAQVVSKLQVFPSNLSRSNLKLTSKEVATTVIEYDSLIAAPQPTESKTWIIIVGIVAGLLLLLIIILAMWKLGFFKSKYKEMKQQAQQDADNDGDAGNMENQVPSVSTQALTE